MNAETPALTASQRYYQSHKDQRRTYGREYYAKNRDRILSSIAAKKEASINARPVVVETPTTTVVDLNQASPLAPYRGRGPRVSVREGTVALNFA
jgi:hypothetical protein